MKLKKYEFTGETKNHFGITLRQIRALVTIVGVVSSGEVGGWIESEKCLDHAGNAWVSGNAWVYGNARVSGNARVYGNAQVDGRKLWWDMGSDNEQWHCSSEVDDKYLPLDCRG